MKVKYDLHMINCKNHLIFLNTERINEIGVFVSY